MNQIEPVDPAHVPLTVGMDEVRRSLELIRLDNERARLREIAAAKLAARAERRRGEPTLIAMEDEP